MFSVCSHLGGEGVQVSQLTGGGGQVQPAGGGVRSSWPGGGQVQPGGVRSSRGGGQVQPPGGGGGGSVSRGGRVSILRPLAGGMPLAFTQEDFLVKLKVTAIQFCTSSFIFL